MIDKLVLHAVMLGEYKEATFAVTSFVLGIVSSLLLLLIKRTLSLPSEVGDGRDLGTLVKEADVLVRGRDVGTLHA